MVEPNQTEPARPYGESKVEVLFFGQPRGPVEAAEGSGRRSDRLGRFDMGCAGLLTILVAQKGYAHLDFVDQGFLGEASVQAEPLACNGLSADLLGLGSVPDIADRLVLDIANSGIVEADLDIAVVRMKKSRRPTRHGITSGGALSSRKCATKSEINNSELTIGSPRRFSSSILSTTCFRSSCSSGSIQSSS